MGARELGMVLVSALLHAAWNAVAKRNDQPTAFLFLLTAVSFVFALVLVPFMPLAAFGGGMLWILLVSCALHGSSFIVLSRAYEAGELSLVYPIARSTPAIVPLLAVPLLHEHVSGVGIAGIALTMIGMWLVQTGGAVHLRMLRQPAALWAYGMLLLTAAFSIVDKHAMTQLSHVPWSSPMPRALAFYLLQTAGAALVCAPHALMRVGRQRLLGVLRARGGQITLAATATLLSYALVLEALRTAQVSYVVAVRQCSVLFAVAFAVWALSERPSRARMTGTLGTIAGVVLIALYA
jgi:drug/metabolite transporter (DMT)-like permease